MDITGKSYYPLMVIFLFLWTLVLGIVYFKIKRSGMTAPKKRIFILHIVLVLLVLALNVSAHLVMKKSEYWYSQFNNSRKWNCWAAYFVIV